LKTKLEFYALTVCFAAVVCLVISGGIAGYAIVKVISPETTLSSYIYERHQSNFKFRSPENCPESDANIVSHPSESELTKQRIESYEIELRSERRTGVQTLIESLMFILAGSIALVIHWRIARNARSGQ
jgi:hypothetical protein